MNSVQEWIARASGLAGELDELNKDVVALEDAQEHLVADNALLQRQIEDLDYLNIYDINTSVLGIMDGRDRKQTILRLRRLRQENPLAKQAVKLCLRFTLGKGIQYTIAPDPDKADPSTPSTGNEAFPDLKVIPGGKLPEVPPPNFTPKVEQEDDQLTEIVKSFWTDPENEVIFTSHRAMKEWVDDCYTDGERFFALFSAEAAPYVRLADVPMDEIKHTIYHPDNRKIPIYYKRVFQPLVFDDEAGYKPDGNPETKYYLDFRVTEKMLTDIGNRIRIPANKKADDNVRIFHCMPNPLWTKAGQRGISELYASREWFKVFKEFMEDRAGINAAATAIAYKRKVKGGPTAVAQFKNKLGGLDVGYENENNTSVIRKLTKPSTGAIYDTNQAVDLEWNKADTGAVNAKEDARMLLMAAGAGVGTFVTYFGEGGDANLATAQAMELPMVKSFEDWQEWVNQDLRALMRYVITVATSEEEAVDAMKRVSFNFPPIITQDVVKWMTAWVQVVTSIAPGNEVVHREAIRGALTTLGVQNIDGLMPLIQDEQKRLELQKQVERAKFDQMLADGGGNPANDGGDSRDKPVSGSGPGANFQSKPPSRAMPADLQRVAQGKPPVERKGRTTGR